ncbi:hypothetical protein EMMF5_003960 [Cystobasidiomycetes sp. EMM_F5]
MKFGSFLSSGLVVVELLAASTCANPIDIEKRDAVSGAEGILNSATAQVHGIGLKIAAAVPLTNFHDAASIKTHIVPLVSQINGVVGDAAGKINALAKAKKAGAAKEKRQSADALAAARLNGNLVLIATGLGIILAGVLDVVRDLLAGLAGALGGIGLGGLLALLGL